MMMEIIDSKADWSEKGGIQGFTLIELLVVIAIIAILAACQTVRILA
jgi:prepilin-type N-terminal cleavage/methylation domain-containing protein